MVKVNRERGFCVLYWACIHASATVTHCITLLPVGVQPWHSARQCTSAWRARVLHWQACIYGSTVDDSCMTWNLQVPCGNFWGIQFSRKGHLQRFRDLIFTDGLSSIKNMRSSFSFRGFNFRGLPVNRENRENWIPRKFPAIRYSVEIYAALSCAVQRQCNQIEYQNHVDYTLGEKCMPEGSRMGHCQYFWHLLVSFLGFSFPFLVLCYWSNIVSWVRWYYSVLVDFSRQKTCQWWRFYPK